MWVIGLLAVLAIAASVLAPVLIRLFDRSAREQELKEMQVLVEGLRQHIVGQRRIPGTNEFAAAIAAEVGWGVNQVRTNARGLRRVYWMDPVITNTLAIPYTQGWLGLERLVPPRMGVMLLSSVAGDLPATVVDGFAPGTNAFNAVWNVAEGAVPAGWVWNGDPEDLVFTRLNLSDLFVNLTLRYDLLTVGITNQGRFTIDNSTTNRLPPATDGVFRGRYLRGTVVGLRSHVAPYPLQASLVLRHPEMFVYETDRWKGELFMSSGVGRWSGMHLQMAMDLFLGAPPNVNAKKGNTSIGPQDIINDMAAYMVRYIDWANAGFPGTTPPNPNTKSHLDAAQVSLEQTTAGYLTSPSAGSP